jgi:hypothetical protein
MLQVWLSLVAYLLLLLVVVVVVSTIITIKILSRSLSKLPVVFYADFCDSIKLNSCPFSEVCLI